MCHFSHDTFQDLLSICSFQQLDYEACRHGLLRVFILSSFPSFLDEVSGFVVLKIYLLNSLGKKNQIILVILTEHRGSLEA